MNSTPKLRSAFPLTPQTHQKWGNVGFGTTTVTHGENGSAQSRATAPLGEAFNDSHAPLIPFTILDAPTQRLYVVAFYALLTAWRFYDYSILVTNETDSLWLFMKWAAIDGVLLYGLPSLKIPWLEWSSASSTAIFLLHALFDAFLMFRIPLPLGIWLSGLTRLLYDRELAVSERRVKPASILHNSSLILGKQIVHILPEGSAMLNPESLSLCLSDTSSIVQLPILLNQSNPILIELLRIDLDINDNETITIGMKESQRLKRQAEKAMGKNDVATSRLLKYPIRRPGLYRLQKVLDETKLEVQRMLSDALVVRCPSAFVKAPSQGRCKGSLSDFAFQVDATPPLKIKYSKVVNREDKGFVVLPVHPTKLITPLSQRLEPGLLVPFDSKGSVDVSWAQTQHIEVPLNETFDVAGDWRYSIEEVHDALGNVANYSVNDGQRTHRPAHGRSTEQVFSVHDRPKISFVACSSQHPLKAPVGKLINLPIMIEPISYEPSTAAQFEIQYLFTPQEALTATGNHAEDAAIRTIAMAQHGPPPAIQKPGLYSLLSVRTGFCSGDILEPSNCLLLNPPKPDLTYSYQNITDKCVGSHIGLLVDLDLVGSPPFHLSYNVHRRGEGAEILTVNIDKLRAQLEFRPLESGYYTYEFLSITDAVYNDSNPLRSKVPKLKQDVKPQASARFDDIWLSRKACIEERALFPIRFFGEAPWTLKYELLKGSKKASHVVDQISEEYYTLWTDELAEGGEYSLSLASVTDKSGCEVFLDEVAKISVRHQRPKASFGEIDGQRRTLMLEGKKLKLPLRLTGESPWKVSYRRVGQGDAVHLSDLSDRNGFLEVTEQDVYELIDVQDRQCPGTIDALAKQFEVLWIARPTIRLADSFSVEKRGGKYVKKAVCEGDQDSLELLLSGNPPYRSKYTINLQPEKGQAPSRTKIFQAGLGSASVQMDTSAPGDYEYRFVELGDHLYDNDPRRFIPLSVQQKVFSKPLAKFTDPSKTYDYCLETDTEDQSIRISLSGTPPFSIEIGIRQRTNKTPRIINIPHIDGHNYAFRIPRGKLGLGRHNVFINKVRDVNNCQLEVTPNSQSIMVSVADLPSITPMESTVDYCVGDRISYTLAGTAPFSVFYTFQGAERKAVSSTTTFRRIAEKPGEFTIIGISDKASTNSCRAKTSLTKVIHELPSVRISKGRVKEVDIHEGGDSEILFEFGGTPPFEFTFTRSTNAAKGKKSMIIETRSDVSYEHTKTLRVSEEGTYEVVSIKDRYCGFSTQVAQGKANSRLIKL